MTYNELIVWALERGFELQVFRNRQPGATSYFDNHYKARFYNFYGDVTKSCEIVADSQSELLSKIEYTLKNIYMDLTYIPLKKIKDEKIELNKNTK